MSGCSLLSQDPKQNIETKLDQLIAQQARTNELLELLVELIAGDEVDEFDGDEARPRLYLDGSPVS